MLRLVLIFCTLLFIQLRLYAIAPPGGVGKYSDYWYELNAGISYPSPNAASLGSFGNLQMAKPLGSISHSVPVYTLKSAHLELPITLSYSSNGMRVDEISSNIGHGWSLFTGGIITRTVYQKADEYADWANSRLKSVWLDEYHPLSSSNPFMAELAFYIFWTTQVSPTYIDNDSDSQADIFQYNVAGYSGSFILDDDLQPQVIKGSNQVQLSFNPSAAPHFTLTDPHGIRYEFGKAEWDNTSGELGSRIRTYCKYLHLNPGHCTMDRPYKNLAVANTAWFLTKIVHPQGDSLVFSYSQSNELYTYGYHEEFRDCIFHEDSIDIGTTGCIYPFHTHGAPDKLKMNTFTYGYTKANKHSWQLDSITATNGLSVNFTYSHSPRLDMESGGAMLSAITIKSGNTEIKKFTLTQVPKQSTKNAEVLPEVNMHISQHYRYFLTRFSEQSLNTVTPEIAYQFEYNGLDSLPHRFLRAQDYGGFYNGSTANRLIPCIVEPNSAGKPTADDSNRMPNWQYAQQGVLNRIIYPTGGETLISCEANTANQKTFPGLRVAKIEDIPGTGAPSVITKYYYNDYINRNTPAAKVNPYISIEEAHQDEIEQYYMFPGIPSPYENVWTCCLTDPEAITYRYKMYYSSARNYFNETYTGLPFYDVITQSYGGENFESGGKTSWFKFVHSDIHRLIGLRYMRFGVYDNTSMYNGELEATTDFKLNQGIYTPVKEELYSYQETETYSRNNLVSVYQYPNPYLRCIYIDLAPWVYPATAVSSAYKCHALATYKIYGKVLNLMSKTTKFYDSDGLNPIIKTESYTYNNRYQPVSITYKDSEGQVLKDSISYATQFYTLPSGNTHYAVFQLMKNKNQQDYVVERVRYSDNRAIAGELLLYERDAGHQYANVSRQYRLATDSPLASHVFFNGTGIPANYVVERDFLYNTNNKLREVTFKNLQKTSYIWGYNNTHLVAKVENAPYSSLGLPNNQPLPGALSVNNENIIRALNNVLVTTCIWAPGIGLLSEKDLNGLTTYYEYDEFGRLKRVKDHLGNILQEYDYKYGGQ